MKLHKLISKTVLATALLGATIGGSFVGINNVNAGSGESNGNNTQEGQPNSSSSGSSSQGGSSNSSSSGSNQQEGTPSGSTDNSSVNNPQFAGSDSGSGSIQSGGTKSSSSTTINDGSLSLDSVPNFNFSSNDKENNNTLSLSQSGTLKVTDYRNQDKGKTGRWSVNVSTDGFQQNNNYDSNNWKVNFNKSSIDDLQNIDSSIKANTPLNTSTLNANDKSGSNQYDPISDGRYGITQATYKDSDATLNIPNVKPDSNKPYTTNMNWNLSTNFKSEDNSPR